VDARTAIGGQGHGEAAHRETRPGGGSNHEIGIDEGAERAANIRAISAYAQRELLEIGGGATAGEADDGAKDLEFVAHTEHPMFSTEQMSKFRSRILLSRASN
jgi:hypothetical protein